MLLLDDIHLLEKKPGTQDQLFYTFEALHRSYKQMVFACDRPPHELQDFNDRLKSRFSQGVICSLGLPNYETRFAILRDKLQRGEFGDGAAALVDDAILDFIAANVATNIRDLEGALKTAAAYAAILNRRLTIEDAKHCLNERLAGDAPANADIPAIQKFVAAHYRVSVAELVGASRKAHIAAARNVAVYLSRKLTEMSLQEIGGYFNRNHSTIMHSCDQVERRIEIDPSFAETIEKMKASFRA